MPMHTITAMFHSKNEAERAAEKLRTDSALAVTNVKVLPEEDREATAAPHEQGFLASLRNFFMPEEDRYGFAEGMRRGDYMVAVDADEQHAKHVMDVLEQNGAIDLDAEEARWRNEGWRGFQGASDTAGATTGTAAEMGGAGTATIPPMPGRQETSTTRMSGTESTAAADARRAATTGTVTDRSSAATLSSRDVDQTTAEPNRGAGTEERIPLVEERLRVGKRQVVAGRVRIRSYVVETPVTETVHLRQEHVDVERRAVDRPLGASEADPFREREIEATETREEAVVSKDARVREELVLHKSVEEEDETVRDTVRHTEVREDHGEASPDAAGTVRNPGTTREP